MSFIDTVLDQCIDECKRRFEDSNYHQEWMDYMTSLIFEKMYPYIMTTAALVLVMFVLLIANIILLYLIFSKK